MDSTETESLLVGLMADKAQLEDTVIALRNCLSELRARLAEILGWYSTVKAKQMSNTGGGEMKEDIKKIIEEAKGNDPDTIAQRIWEYLLSIARGE